MAGLGEVRLEAFEVDRDQVERLLRHLRVYRRQAEAPESDTERPQIIALCGAEADTIEAAALVEVRAPVDRERRAREILGRPPPFAMDHEGGPHAEENHEHRRRARPPLERAPSPAGERAA